MDWLQSDDQLLRALCVTISAVSGTASSIEAVCRNADVVQRYIETGSVE